jgi:hypothetical protein
MARREEFTIGRIRVPNTTTANQGSRVTATLTPASVAAATVADQNLSVTGVEVGDMIVCVQNPIITSVGVIGCKCATAGTVAVTFCNPTAGALVPASGAYVFMVIKG